MLETKLNALRASGRKILAPYLVWGYKTDPIETAKRFREAGADVVEFGAPYSDPVMDGHVIASASAEALRGGASLSSTVRNVDEGSVVMTYTNPILAYGIEKFAQDASSVGYQGVIVADLPAVEANPLSEIFARHGLACILLAAPTTTAQHLSSIAALGSGFVYCVSLLGVTGERKEFSSVAKRVVSNVREHTDRPALVGVGISTPAQAAQACEFADGVVVGTALVRALGEGGISKAADLVAEIRAAIDQG